MVAVAVPFNVAVSVAFRFWVKVPVEILKEPEVAPGSTVTKAGAANVGEALSVKVTEVPPAGATPERVTVHNVLWFDVSVVSVHDSAATPAGP
ncbi:MAG TPA: hypothetical protein VMB03_26935 [Bryobacteraceae bacterium]|nr:hypothetical protein [Bryobacteraceae bacterium]